MNFRDHQRNWNRLGEIDPLWAILSDPRKKQNGWNKDEFFKTGEAEIDWLMDYVGSLPVKMRNGEALDFGCGVGRVTQALCKYFDHCAGVDIAGSMIRLANEYNRYDSRCRYYLNEAEDLRMFGDDRFDLIYSNIVLQHMEPKYSKRYIGEFIRILRIGGLAVFQAPSEPMTVRETLVQADLLKADITVTVPSLTAAPDEKITINVNVTNSGPLPWSPEAGTKYPIRLGNHWLSSKGEMLQIDDGRAGIVEVVKPWGSVELLLLIRAPNKPGDYLLELDMVREHIAWFKDRGSHSVQIPVRVTGSVVPTDKFAENPISTLREACPSGEEAAIEMHCISKTVVMDTIAAASGKVVDVHEYGSAGPNYISFLYCVTK